MESKRQNKFSRLIQKELADIFQRDQRHLFHNAFITVTKVNVSPDLSVAKIFLSFFKATNAESALHNLDILKKEIRKQLGMRIAKQVKRVPELVFYHDDSAEYASKIEALLSRLDIPPAEDEPSEDK